MEKKAEGGMRPHERLTSRTGVPYNTTSYYEGIIDDDRMGIQTRPLHDASPGPRLANAFDSVCDWYTAGG
jgi:hypothetical protein